jgi:hypothetical protein
MELVPDIKSAYVWYHDTSLVWPDFIIQKRYITKPVHKSREYPALTLQELMVFISHNKDLRRQYDNAKFRFSLTNTAPELAEWIINKLTTER